MSVWAVLAAAGSGERLGLDRPKAFANLRDRPLLAETLERLEASDWIDSIVVAVPPGWEEPAILLAEEIGAGKVVACVTGGATRAESVRAAVAEVGDDAAVILVHDAARPLVDDDVIERVLAPLSEGYDGAVPTLSLADTVKRVRGGEVVETLDRRRARRRADAAGVSRCRAPERARGRRRRGDRLLFARGSRRWTGRGRARRPPAAEGDGPERPRARRTSALGGECGRDRRLPHAPPCGARRDGGDRPHGRGGRALRGDRARAGRRRDRLHRARLLLPRDALRVDARVPDRALQAEPRPLLRRGARGEAAGPAGQARARGRLGAGARRAARRRARVVPVGLPARLGALDRRRRGRPAPRALGAEHGRGGLGPLLAGARGRGEEPTVRRPLASRSGQDLRRPCRVELAAGDRRARRRRARGLDRRAVQAGRRALSGRRAAARQRSGSPSHRTRTSPTTSAATSTARSSYARAAGFETVTVFDGRQSRQEPLG